MKKVFIRQALAMILPVLLLFGVLSKASAASKTGININTVDTVSTQSEFDALIRKASNREEVEAYLKEGVYKIDVSIPIYTKFRLHGNGAVLTQKNSILSKNDAVRETSTHYVCPIKNIGIFSLFVDTEGNIIPISEDVDSESKVNYITEDVIPIESQDSPDISKIKLKIPDNLNHLRNQSFSKAFGYIDSWWTAPSFAITHSDSKNFYCELLEPRSKERFNSYINGEKFEYKENIASVLYNVFPQPDKIFYTDEYVFIPQRYEEVEIIDYNKDQPLFIPQEKADLTLENIDIINSNYVVFPQKNLTGGITFQNCRFRNILQNVINTAYLSVIEYISIDHCEFLDCSLIEYIPLIRIFAPNCKGSITHSIFNQYTGGFCFYKNVMQYLYLHTCKEFDIIDNIFINNPRGALFLLNGNFTVTNNEFYNDSAFNSFQERNFSRDAGAIYCNKLYFDYPKNKDSTYKINLRFNKIHDFYGKGDVRGIFIDDGRGDVTCYGNLIFNGQSYSIDSRVNSNDPYSSIRNKYQYNIVDRPYRLMYGESVPKSDRPILKSNILLFSGDNKVTTQSSNDIRVSEFKIDGPNVKIKNNILKKIPKEVRDLVNPLK